MHVHLFVTALRHYTKSCNGLHMLGSISMHAVKRPYTLLWPQVNMADAILGAGFKLMSSFAEVLAALPEQVLFTLPCTHCTLALF
jgi:hypothetical protein